MTSGTLPPENTIDDVKVRIQESYKNPNVRRVTQTVLKEGPRAFKIASLMEIINPTTDEFHHYSLKIDHIDKTKSGWFYKPERSVRLEGNESDEIKKLLKFLAAAYQDEFNDASGEMHLISSDDYAKLENLVEAIPKIADTDKIHLVGTLISQLDEDSSSIASFVNAFAESGIETIKHIATASRLIEYSKSLQELRELVGDSNTAEREFQKHLEVNPWMFGSEYSELLPRKTWPRGDRLDYMLRKTVDDYLEIVEIKTAFDDALFLKDTSHDSYYPSSKLSPVIGQVTRYIEEVERNRDSILVTDDVGTLKIRARVIVGRDGSAEHQAALRNFNSHLHRIEIITYDQLIRIAERVLGVFDPQPEDGEEEDDGFKDIPF
jgi:hypothetical protein